jgi:hypothetical protein
MRQGRSVAATVGGAQQQCGGRRADPGHEERLGGGRGLEDRRQIARQIGEAGAQADQEAEAAARQQRRQLGGEGHRADRGRAADRRRQEQQGEALGRDGGEGGEGVAGEGPADQLATGHTAEQGGGREAGAEAGEAHDRHRELHLGGLLEARLEDLEEAELGPQQEMHVGRPDGAEADPALSAHGASRSSNQPRARPTSWRVPRARSVAGTLTHGRGSQPTASATAV